MKVSYYGGMPYGAVRDRSAMSRWPVPNELFEAEQAVRARDIALEEFEAADQLGFDWVSLAEHHYSPGSLAPNLTVLAAALTQRVKQAKIAILGPLLPLNNPVRIAEEVAMVDLLSGGRVVVALLRGAPYEYMVYNINPAESRGRFEEAWELIMKAWTDPRPFGWEGNHYHFRNVSVWPRPLQQPMPPVIMSGSSKDSGEFAARKRVALGLAFTNIILASEASRFYREKALEYGWQPSSEQILYRLRGYVAETDEKAREELRSTREGGAPGGAADANRLVASAGFFGQRDSQLTHRFQHLGEESQRTLEDQIEMANIICGGPASVIQQIKRIRDEIGCGVLEVSFLAPQGSRELKMKSIELFAKEVLPEVHDL